MKNIRNFSIIAHIDHGKSTLSDRLLEITNTIEKREMHGQMLDRMDIEQERGITIKLTPVRMDYKDHILNLIDTPGHVDFTYEVSRSLAACEGAVLVVDASQGIEAQTLANTYLALEHDLEIIPVLNKIDLPAADPERVAAELHDFLGIDPSEILKVSAKTGVGCEELLDKIIEKVPSPRNVSGPARGLIFDSIYDPYRGVVTYVRNFGGEFKKGDNVKLMKNRGEFEILETGYFRPDYHKADVLKEGEVGYFITGLKSVGEAKVGDTIANKKTIEETKALDGYKEITPFVYASIFTVDTNDFGKLREALEKLSLNDSSLTFEPEQSTALGFGFRCGFLGLLHLEVVQERLEREFDLDLISTAPSVAYQVLKKNGDTVDITNPSEWPDGSEIEECREPYTLTEILTPPDRLGAILKLLEHRRGIQKEIKYLSGNRVQVIYEVPLAEIVIDFYDALKSVSAGYASMSYEILPYRADDLCRVSILVAGEDVAALSFICHRSQADKQGRNVCAKLKDILPRQQFSLALQAAIGGKVIARETISAFRKDVTAKLYGGDRTRKDKLLKKQAAGKKRMKKFGRVEIPQAAFRAILKRD